MIAGLPAITFVSTNLQGTSCYQIPGEIQEDVCKLLSGSIGGQSHCARFSRFSWRSVYSWVQLLGLGCLVHTPRL